MTESEGLPVLYGLRLVEVGGKETLAWDFARKDGAPVAVTGPNAVPCPRCKADTSVPCGRPRSRAEMRAPHFERVMAMNGEMKRLRDERDA